MRDLPKPDLEGELDAEVVRAIAVEAKAHLRKRARGLRQSVPRGGIEARSRRVVEHLLALAPVGSARTIALFDAIAAKNEVDLRALDAALRARGVTVAYPSIDRASRAMTFRDPGDPSKMAERGMLAREPAPHDPEIASLDVIVVPALLVDARGFRLGYGGGFYDATLPRYCPPARSIAVAFAFQVAADLPVEAHDVACDLVVTDAGLVERPG